MNAVELSKILIDEAWLEGERRGRYTPTYDDDVFNRSVKIWDNLTLDHYVMEYFQHFGFIEDWYYDVE